MYSVVNVGVIADKVAKRQTRSVIHQVAGADLRGEDRGISAGQDFNLIIPLF